MTEPIRILYVEDNALDRELVRDALEIEHTGFILTLAASRQEFEARLEEGGYDLVLTDFNILGFDGLQAIDLVRSKHPSLPVVIVTGTGSEEVAVEAMKRAAADYVIKTPKHIQRLPQTILTVLEKKRMADEIDLAHNALVENEKRFRLLYEHAPVAYQSLDEGGHIIEVNNSWLEALGYTREEVVSTWFGDYLGPGYDEAFYHRFLCFKADGEVRGVEFEMVRKDGSHIFVVFDGTIGHDEDGRFKQTHCVFHDITETRKAQRALKESEEKYRVVVENAGQGILVAQDGILRFVNPAAARILGREREQLMDRPFIEFIHSDDTEMVLQRHYQRLAGEDVPDSYPLRVVHESGNFKWTEIGSVVIGWNNEPAVLVFITDVDQRRRSEEVQRRLATAVEQAVESIFITDSGGNIQYVNPAFEQVTGYERDEVIGKRPTVLKSDEHDRAFYREMISTIRRGEPWRGRITSKRKDGKLYTEDVTISPVRDPSGKIVNYVDVGHDVTQQVDLQKQLVQAQKMEAVGTLAGGVAHDFNNVLQVTLGYAEMLLLNRKPEDSDYEGLQKISHAAGRGAQLVKQLLAFSRKSQTKQRPLNVNEQVELAVQLMSRTIPKMIEIVVRLDHKLMIVNADPAQMEQVLMNLGLNARDAMPDGGKLIIETSNIVLDEEYCSTHPEVKPGRYVQLAVSDTGHGMGKETLQHIFEPFYTTKETGKGTGLGLAMVYGIVGQHGGTISCYSELGHGTTFRIFLPVVETEPEAESTEEDTAMPEGGTETILLVDDDELISSLGADLLSRCGYTVLNAVSGEQALDLYKKEGEKIDLVVLDLIMPGIGGKQCLEHLLGINPHVKVLIASGFALDRPTAKVIGAGAKGLVTKPYNLRQFLKTVREVLDQTEQ